MKENLVNATKSEYHLAIEGIKYGLFRIHYGCKRWEGTKLMQSSFH
jgi:hypothetical protein